MESEIIVIEMGSRALALIIKSYEDLFSLVRTEVEKHATHRILVTAPKYLNDCLFFVVQNDLYLGVSASSSAYK